VVGHALARESLDPPGGRLVLAGALRAWDLGVGDVADEAVPERELRLALDRREARGTDQLPAPELVQPIPDAAVVEAADGGDRTGPEHLPDDGGVLDQALPCRAERVEPRGDQRVDRLGDGNLPLGRALAHHLHELLSVERVSPRTLEQGLLGLGGQDRALEQRSDQPRRLVARER